MLNGKSTNARSRMPTTDSNQGRIEILWVENEAETIECSCDDVEKRHWKKAVESRETDMGVHA